MCVYCKGGGDVAGIVSGLRAGRSAVQIPAGARDFFLAKRLYWFGTNGPPIQRVPGALSLWGVNRPGCHADHSPPPSAKSKNEYRCTSAILDGLCRGSFIFKICSLFI